MKVLTYATHESQYFNSFKESCKKYNYDLKILGLGDKWEGFAGKTKKIYNYLLKEKGEDFVIVCDAFDVIMTKDSSEFMEGFYKNFDIEDVVFNAEAINSYAILPFWIKKYKINKDKLKIKSKYKLLNAGVYIGKIKNIRNILKKTLDTNIGDDQLAFTEIYNKSLYNIKIDSKCKLFSTISSLNNDISVIKKKIYNNYTKTYPFILHGPGPYTRLEPYIKKIDLTSSYEKNKKTEYFYYYLCNTADYLIITVIFLIIYILIIIKRRYK